MNDDIIRVSVPVCCDHILGVCTSIDDSRITKISQYYVDDDGGRDKYEEHEDINELVWFEFCPNCGEKVMVENG